MTPHRPPGSRPAAHSVRSTVPHIHAHREPKKPRQAGRGLSQFSVENGTVPVSTNDEAVSNVNDEAVSDDDRDHTRDWPAWTNDFTVASSLPPLESAIVVAFDRLGRPETAGALSVYSWSVGRASAADRNAAIASLVRRGVLVRVEAVKPHPLMKPSDPSTLTFFGFPEHFEFDAEETAADVLSL